MERVEGEGGCEGFIGLSIAVLVFVLLGEFEIVRGDVQSSLLDVDLFLLELIEGIESDLFTCLNGAEA